MDWVRELSKLIAQGDTTRVSEAAANYLREIEMRIAELQQQASVVRSLASYYAPRQLTYQKEPGPRVLTAPEDGFSSQDRSRLVRNAALELAAAGQLTVRAGDVISELERRGIKFSVKRPGSMAGTVLANTPEFKRMGFDQFQYTGGAVEPTVTRPDASDNTQSE